MARYDAPPDPYEIFEKGCLRVYYPNSPFLFRALMGQLSYLENRFVWDTGGDLVAADKLEQDWLEAGELTRQSQLEGCGDCGDSEQTIIDLTIELEECKQRLEEIENMEININCGCGCCGANDLHPAPVDETGVDVNTQPINVDPNNPFGEFFPEWDGELDEPPDGWPDNQSFVDDRCLMANYVVDSFLGTNEALDDAENRASIILDIASIALILVPAPVGKTKGFLTIAKWIAKLLSFINLIEEPLDYMQWLADIVEDNRKDIVCLVYSATDYETVVQDWVQIMFDGLAGISGYNLLSAEAKDKFDDFVTAVLGDLVPMAFSYAARVHIPEDYEAPINCATCGDEPPDELSGFQYIPALVESVPSFSSNGSQVGSVVEIVENSVTISVTGHSGNSRTDANIVFVKPPIPSVGRYQGICWEYEIISGAPVNNTSGRHNNGHAGMPQIANSGVDATDNPLDARKWFTRDETPLEALPIAYPSDDFSQTDACLLNEYDVTRLTIGIGVNVTVGDAVWRIKNIYWVLDESVAQ